MTACKSNCKNLATALEMYAADNQGQYPKSLNLLANGSYLKLLPTCPSARKFTYGDSYQVSQSPDKFSFCCHGDHHARAYTGFAAPSLDYPRYDSEQGLLDHP